MNFNVPNPAESRVANCPKKALEYGDMVCKHKGSIYVSKIYPNELGEMIQAKGKKSIDLYLESENLRKLKVLLSKVSDNGVLHFILMDITEGRSSKRVQMMVEECDRIPGTK